MPMVNRTRLRRSGIRKILRNFSSMAKNLLQAAVRRWNRSFHLTASSDSESEYRNREDAAREGDHTALKYVCRYVCPDSATPEPGQLNVQKTAPQAKTKP